MQQDFVSKTRRKREMHELQRLGAALVALAPARLEAGALPEGLLAAVREARRMTSHEAKRRQLQYIGKLMRDIDPEPVRALLAEAAGQSAAARARQLRLEQWRERLIGDETALTEFALQHAGVDMQALRALIRNARKEIAEGRPPRAQRELFRSLREILEVK
ncbi:MAG: ribosome biogenesis factor YjgA [Pseudomonadota bacterium]